MSVAGRGQFTAKCKRYAVPRFLRVEDLDLLVRELDATGAMFAGWRHAFLERCLGVMRTRDRDEQDATVKQFQRKLDEVIMANWRLPGSCHGLHGPPKLSRKPWCTTGTTETLPSAWRCDTTMAASS
jgi:hypothetical protein